MWICHVLQGFGCSVLFFRRPRSQGWPHHGHTFSIYLWTLSFWMTLPRRVLLSTSWCCPPWNPSKVSLVTISARMLNKYGERTQPCRTLFSARNHSDSVLATLTLASCFLYSLASKSIKCTGYLMSIIITQSLSWEIESNAYTCYYISFGCWRLDQSVSRLTGESTFCIGKLTCHQLDLLSCNSSQTQIMNTASTHSTGTW